MTITRNRQRGYTLLKSLSILMVVFMGIILWTAVGPEICSASPENLRYQKFGSFIFLAYLGFSLLTGVVRFRSQRVVRVESPFDYWLMVLSIAGFTLFLFYPIYSC